MATMTAQQIKDRVRMLFLSHGLTSQNEYRLPNGRSLDVAGFGKTGYIAGVEVKITPKDFNRDLKWPSYLPFCKTFYFAVPLGFPVDILPVELGVIVCNPYRAEFMRGLSKRNRISPTVLLRA